MTTRHRPTTLGALAIGLTMILTACSAAGSPAQTPSSSPAPTTPTTTPSEAPGTDPVPPAPSLPIATGPDAMAAIVLHDRRFAKIAPFDPNLIGQSAWYKAQPASGVGAFVVTIQMGWGDCESGCIDKHLWNFAVLPDGGVNLQSETGSPLGADGMPPASGS